MSRRRIVVIYVWIIVLLAMSIVATATAQSPADGWSQPVPIVTTEGQLALHTFVADKMGRLHLFYVDRPDENLPGTINYLKWDDSGWSEPVDVIFDSEAVTPGQPRAAIHGQWSIHLIWGGDNRSLRYATAPLAEAGSARGWSIPQTIAVSLPSSHDILVAPSEVLYVVYADVPDDQNRVFIINSTDLGKTWTAPTLVAKAVFGSVASDVRLAIDGAGRLHVVWTEYPLPDGYPPTGVFYSRSTDGGATWDAPRQMALERHGQIGVGTVGDGAVHLVWRGSAGGDGTFHQRSMDGGESWALPDYYDDGGGLSGLPSFATDSIGRLHYAIGRGFYAMWDGRQLSEYVDVATEQVRATVSLSDGEQALLALTAGNRVHVVFETGFQSVWHTTLALDTPVLPTATVGPAATVSSQVTQTLPQTSIPEITAQLPTPLPSGQPLSPAPPQQGASQTVVVVLGVVPALLIVAACVIVVALRRHS